MTGQELRSKLVLANVQVTELARIIGTSHQSLSQALTSKDVKTGLVEKLASALNLPLSYFYGEEGDVRAVANGHKAIAAINSTISPQSEKAVLEEKIRGMEKLLTEKERTIKAYEQLLSIKFPDSSPLSGA